MFNLGWLSCDAGLVEFAVVGLLGVVVLMGLEEVEFWAAGAHPTANTAANTIVTKVGNIILKFAISLPPPPLYSFLFMSKAVCTMQQNILSAQTFGGGGRG